MSDTTKITQTNGIKTMLTIRFPRVVLAVPCALLVLLGIQSWRLIAGLDYAADDGMEVLTLPNPLAAAQHAHYMAAAAARDATNAPGRTVTSLSREKVPRDRSR